MQRTDTPAIQPPVTAAMQQTAPHFLRNHPGPGLLAAPAERPPTTGESEVTPDTS